MFLNTREIFRVLDLMKGDMVNLTIENLRHVLQVHGVEYERAEFQSILEKVPSECTQTLKQHYEKGRWLKDNLLGSLE